MTTVIDVEAQPPVGATAVYEDDVEMATTAATTTTSGVATVDEAPPPYYSFSSSPPAPTSNDDKKQPAIDITAMEEMKGDKTTASAVVATPSIPPSSSASNAFEIRMGLRVLYGFGMIISVLFTAWLANSQSCESNDDTNGYGVLYASYEKDKHGAALVLAVLSLILPAIFVWFGFYYQHDEAWAEYTSMMKTMHGMIMACIHDLPLFIAVCIYESMHKHESSYFYRTSNHNWYDPDRWICRSAYSTDAWLTVVFWVLVCAPVKLFLTHRAYHTQEPTITTIVTATPTKLKLLWSFQTINVLITVLFIPWLANSTTCYWGVPPPHTVNGYGVYYVSEDRSKFQGALGLACAALLLPIVFHASRFVMARIGGDEVIGTIWDFHANDAMMKFRFMFVVIAVQDLPLFVSTVIYVSLQKYKPVSYLYRDYTTQTYRRHYSCVGAQMTDEWLVVLLWVILVSVPFKLGIASAARESTPSNRASHGTGGTGSADGEHHVESRAMTNWLDSRLCVLRYAVIVLFVSTIGLLFWVLAFAGSNSQVLVLLHVVKVILMVGFGVAVYFYYNQQHDENTPPRAYKSYRALIIVFGVILMLVALCCCFDADATVWRRHHSRHDHNHHEGSDKKERVRLRDLRIGDEVLAVNPYTRESYWEPVVAKAHFSFFDGGYQLNSMRTLVLKHNISSITLSHTHFIHTHEVASSSSSSLVQLKLAQDVRVGDCVLYYNASSGSTIIVPIEYIESHVERQKRAFFLPSPYVLVNDIVASPYMGMHTVLAEWQHTVFSTVHSFVDDGIFMQAFVTTFTVPFLIINNIVESIEMIVSVVK